MRNWVRLAGLLLLGLALNLDTHALLISNIEFDLALPRGAHENFAFQIINNEADPLEIQISLVDWDRDINGENRFHQAGTLPRSAARWLSVSPLRFDLARNEQKEVKFSLRVPRDIEGTHWAAILVEASPKQAPPQPGTTVIVRRRFAVKVFETPPGTGKRDGRITMLDVRGLNPVNVWVEFENRGTVHVQKVSGHIEIRDEKGSTVDKIEFDSFPTLPGAKRQLKVTSSRKRGELLPPGRYAVIAVLDYAGESLAGGQHILRINPLKLAPIGDAKNPPQDLDKDGLYEDVNADGRFSIEDAALLGFNIDKSPVQENVRAFDFDNDGDTDFEDVLTLKKMAEEQNR